MRREEDRERDSAYSSVIGRDLVSSIVNIRNKERANGIVGTQEGPEGSFVAWGEANVLNLYVLE